MKTTTLAERLHAELLPGWQAEKEARKQAKQAPSKEPRPKVVKRHKPGLLARIRAKHGRK